MKSKKIISNLAVVVPTTFNLLNHTIQIKEDSGFSIPMFRDVEKLLSQNTNHVQQKLPRA